MPLPFVDGVRFLKNLGVSPIAFAEESRKVSSLSGKDGIGMMDLLSFLKVYVKQGYTFLGEDSGIVISHL